MNKENIENYFSKMTWLKEELEYHENSKGKNEKSYAYYDALKRIYKKQQSNQIPSDEEYMKLGIDRKSLNTVEYGYYTSNIHYDLFEYEIDEKDLLEDRILFFLNSADKKEISNEEGWFLLNFPLNFRNYLLNIYEVDKKDLKKKKHKDINELSFDIDKDLNELFTVIDNIGNEKERLIFDELIKNINN